MKVTERQVGDITVVDAEGKLMLGEGDETFKEAISRIVESGRMKLILNMAEVPYMDSAGISEIVRTYVTMSKRGGQMRLLSLTRRVHEVLAITKLLTVFETFDSEEEAIGSFGASPRPS